MKPHLIALVGLISVCAMVQAQDRMDSLLNEFQKIRDPSTLFQTIKKVARGEQNRQQRLAILHLFDPRDFPVSDTSRISHLYQLAEVHLMLNNLDSFTYYFDVVMVESKSAKSAKYSTAGLNAYAHYMGLLGKHDSAIYYYKQTLNMIKQIVPDRNYSQKRKMLTKADVLGNLSGVFFNIKDFESSRKYLQESEEINLQHEFHESSVYNQIRLSLLERKEGNLEKALSHNIQAIETLKIVKDSSLLLFCYINRSHIETDQSNLKAAEKYLNKSEQLALKIADNPNYLDVLNLKAKVYLKMRNNRKAEETAEKLLVEAKKVDNAGGVENALKRLYEAKEAEADFAAALDYRNQFFVHKDSIRGAATQERIAELQTQYETEKKEAEIAKLSHENELKDLRLAGAGIISLSVILTLIIYLTQRAKKQRAIREGMTYQLEALQKRLLDLNLNPYEKSLNAQKLNEQLKTPLTEREFEVLELTIKENSNADIGNLLFVSIKTVKFHLGNIYKKLGVSNRKEALAFVNKTL